MQNGKCLLVFASWDSLMTLESLSKPHSSISTRGWWHGANIIGYDIPVHGALEFPVNWRPQGQSTNSIISMWQPEIVIVLSRKWFLGRRLPRSLLVKNTSLGHQWRKISSIKVIVLKKLNMWRKCSYCETTVLYSAWLQGNFLFQWQLGALLLSHRCQIDKSFFLFSSWKLPQR